MTEVGLSHFVKQKNNVPKALKENLTRFSTSFTGVWGIPKRFKGVKGWVSGIGYEGKSWVPFILSLEIGIK